MPPAAPTHRQRGGAPLLPAPGRRTGTAAGRPPDSSEMPQHAARSSGLRKSSDRILRATIRTSSLRERGFKSLCPSGKGQASHRTSPAELLGGWAASVPRHRAARRSPGSLRHTTPPPPILHSLLLPSLSTWPVALGEKEAAGSSFSVLPYTPKWTVRKRRRWQVWGSSRHSCPAPEGRAWKRRRGRCLSQPVLRFSRVSVQNPCSAGLQKRTGLIITLSAKAN